MGSMMAASLREKLLLRPWTLRLLALGVALFVTLAAVGLWGPQLKQWDERTGSAAWSLANGHAQERRVVVVDIDEKSIQALGAWPWPRERMAALLNRLDQEGVSLKLLDVLFDNERPGDGPLKKALASPVPTVAAELFSLDARPNLHGGVLAGALPMPCPAAALTAGGYLGPEAGLLGPGAFAGHITPILDPDGAIRQVPALLCFNGASYAALPVAGAWAADPEGAPRLEPGRSLGSPAWWLHVGEWRLPLDGAGRFRVSYQLPRSAFISVSAVDVLNGQVPPSLLKGAWALVGATAFGAGDAVPTPQGGAVGGVEVHAQALSALLDDRTPYTPRGAAAWPWLAGLLSALLLLLLLRRPRGSAGLWLAGAGVLLAAATFGVHALSLLTVHWWLGWVTPALYALLASGTLGAMELMRMRFERERLYQNLSSYLPEAVAREVALQGPTAQVHAVRHEATVLFVDLRNFSAYCEGRPPEETATVLHLFYSTAAKVVEGHGGVVEQMVGDGIMAVWNGSSPCADHSVRALAAAEELWRTLGAQLPRTSSRRMPLLDVGMGVETGTVLVGSFGPAGRRVHTVLGETVTVAAGLEALTGELAYPILLGPRVVAAAHPENAVALGPFLLPGLSQPRTLHALPVEFDSQRLRLVYEAEGRQQAVG
ncbi:MAG: adenylate/guanylate cyclase domain-containing protein [Betaproteobacteria bacterium]|nr:adenylate/guanylate cyclase domain-containing protein [Betaproteobacteria bacterium]